jgi:hypothetical protein
VRTSNKYLFDHSIVTDGVSCSVQFTVPKSSTELDAEQESGPENKKRRKSKSDWKAPVTKVFEGIVRDKRNPYVFGIDPGRCNMMTVQGWPLDQDNNDQNCRRVRALFKAKHYHNVLQSKAKSERIQNYLNTRDFAPPTDMSSSLQTLKDRAEALCRKRSERPNKYRTDLYCRQKWDTYVRRSKVVHRFVDDLLKVANPDRDPALKPVFLLGNATFDQNMHTTNRDPPGCNLFVKKTLASRDDLILLEVSEYNTTKFCARCHDVSIKSYKTIKIEDEDGSVRSKKIVNRDARHCQDCLATQGHELLHRDYNAAVNIRNQFRQTIPDRHP